MGSQISAAIVIGPEGPVVATAALAYTIGAGIRLTLIVSGTRLPRVLQDRRLRAEGVWLQPVSFWHDTAHPGDPSLAQTNGSGMPPFRHRPTLPRGIACLGLKQLKANAGRRGTYGPPPASAAHSQL